jgi:hypothetical protein
MRIDKRAWLIFLILLLVVAGAIFYMTPYGEPEVRSDFGKIEPFEPQKK